MDHNASEHQSAKFEFTPIGYMKEKQNVSSIPSKRYSETPNHNNDEKTRKIRKTSIDDSLNSVRLFNDTSQFDETLPRLDPERPHEIGNKRNLMNDLKENAQTSNPLKEQQEQMHRLSTENYNLRLKCSSLLKFLNNLTDEGELKKSLDLLEEIQQSKLSYQHLNDQYLELKRNYDELEIKTTNIGNIEGADDDFTQQEREWRQKLEATEAKLKAAEHEARRLERLHVESADKNDVEVQQHKLQVDMLKSNVNELNVLLHDRDRDIEDQKNKIHRLSNQLQEFDHRGSESLQKLEDQLTIKQNSIKNLEKELMNQGHSRQDLESKLRNLQKKYDELEAKHKGHDEEHQKRLIVEKDDKIRRLTQERIKLNETISELRTNCTSLQIQIENISNQNGELKSLQDELQNTKKELAEASQLSKGLQKQIIENTTKNSERISDRVQEKDAEIRDLKRQMKINLQKYEEDIKAKVHDLNIENEITKNQLSRELELIREERDSLKNSYERELKVWKEKYNAVIMTNDEEQGTLASLKRQLSAKTEEINNLNRLVERSRIDQLAVDEKLSRLQLSKDSYKEELKKVGTKLEYLSKEYVKLKEKQGNTMNKEEDHSLQHKYNTMKQKFLEELKSLQDENLSLERRLLDSRNQPQNPSAQGRTISTNQDRIDYYKLRYNTEVKQNNDLRIVNEYLNRVLRASSQQVRLDLLKIKNEVNPFVPTNLKPDYQYSMDYLGGRHLRFRTVALLVLSCVRMKHVAVRHKWDEQRIRYLQRKIAIEEDRISW